MRNRVAFSTAPLLMLWIGAASASANDVPRRPDVRPDLSGTYDVGTLTPIQRRLGGGCHLDRDTVRLVTESGLRPVAVDHYYLKGVPRFAGYMSEGYAARA